MLERRKYPRFELKIDARYRIASPEEVFKAGKTKNISAEGICFVSGEELKPGTYVNLEVILEEKGSPVSLIGEIRWFREIKDRGLKEKKFANGIKLINIPKSDEGRFLKYYCDRMVEKLAGYLKI